MTANSKPIELQLPEDGLRRERAKVVRRTLIVSGVVTLALVATLILVGKPSRWPAVETPPRQGEGAAMSDPAMAARHSSRALARLVREPQNTWSNLAFVWGGAWLMSSAATQLARAAGMAVIAVGVGSFLYHASAAEALRHLDVGTMFWLYLVTVALCVAVVSGSWGRRLEVRAAALCLVALLGAAGLTAARTLLGPAVQPLFLSSATGLAAAAVILTLADIARRLETPRAALELLGIVTVLGIAAACQKADRPGGRLYRPTAVVQAHAAWHVLAAAAVVGSVRLLDRAAAGVLGSKAPGMVGSSLARRGKEGRQSHAD